MPPPNRVASADSETSMKLLETESMLAFMDIGPIAKGHCLIIPKCELSSSCGDRSSLSA